MFEFEHFNLYKKEDFDKYYPIVKDWWEKRGWSPIHSSFLSSNGLIIKKDNKYICAAWIYCTDSLYGIINWVITDNETKGAIKKEAIDLLLEKLEQIGINLGIKLIYTPMSVNSLKKLFMKRNYVPASNNITEFFKKV